MSDWKNTQSPHDTCALWVNNPESICFMRECRQAGKCAREFKRDLEKFKDARIAELEEALRWALAEIEATTSYQTRGQYHAALKRARTALKETDQ